MSDTIVTTISPDGMATITMNRPDVHNAFDETLIAELTAAVRAVDANPAVRVIVLAASGKSFSAGADLNWMKRMAAYTEADNLRDALHLAELMRTIDHARKPTIARVQGAAFGGGVGLVACCDMAVATREAMFSLSEVRLGLIPAVISPYVVQAIGARACRRYFLTAERFSAEDAQRLGLVTAIVDADDLDFRIATLAEQLFKGGPQAIAAAKDLIRAVAGRSIEAPLLEDTANRIARTRAGTEGKEGIAAFLEKRAPSWVSSGGRT